jgi:Amt family ammonium transporter
VNQLIAVVFTAAAAGLVTFILLKIIGAIVGLRVVAESEHAGLDVSEHGESAYNE